MDMGGGLEKSKRKLGMQPYVYFYYLIVDNS